MMMNFLGILIKYFTMRKKNRKSSYSDTPPCVDYNALASKMLEKASSMTYWPTDNIAEYMMRMACKEFSAYDIKSPLANDLRLACIQALADKDGSYGYNSAKINLAAKLKTLHYKHYLKEHALIH